MNKAITTEEFTGRDGVRLVADVGGDALAPSVVFLHGGGQTRHSWGSAMRSLLAAGYHVINFDARGHGDSEWSASGDYRMETLAADLRAVIATLDSAPALVGASMGGATALYAMGNAPPGLAAALVLVDIVPQVESAGANRIIEFMRANPEGFANVEEAADTVAAYYPHRPRPADPSGLMKNLRRGADGRLYWHWDPQVIAAPKTAEPPKFAAQLNAAAERVTAPTLLVRGLKSDIVSDEGVADLRRRLPQLEVQDIGGAGHMVAGDRNDVFSNAVADFLGRCVPLSADAARPEPPPARF